MEEGSVDTLDERLEKEYHCECEGKEIRECWTWAVKGKWKEIVISVSVEKKGG